MRFTKRTPKAVATAPWLPLLIAELHREIPHPSLFADWCSAKSIKFAVPLPQIEAAVRVPYDKISATLDASIKASLNQRAQTLATAVGLKLEKALQRIDEALDAKLTIPVGESYIEVTDHKTRLAAAAKALEIYGAYAPAKQETTLDVGPNLTKLGAAELAVRAAKLSERLKRVTEAPTIDVTPIPDAS